MSELAIADDPPADGARIGQLIAFANIDHDGRLAHLFAIGARERLFERMDELVLRVARSPLAEITTDPYQERLAGAHRLFVGLGVAVIGLWRRFGFRWGHLECPRHSFARRL